MERSMAPLITFATPCDPSFATFERSTIRVHPQVCTAMVLAMGAYRGRFTRAHLEKLQRTHGSSLFTQGLEPLVAAVQRDGAVEIAFVPDERGAASLPVPDRPDGGVPTLAQYRRVRAREGP
jgi:hypothetical protein